MCKIAVAQFILSEYITETLRCAISTLISFISFLHSTCKYRYIGGMYLACKYDNIFDGVKRVSSFTFDY